MKIRFFCKICICLSTINFFCRGELCSHFFRHNTNIFHCKNFTVLTCKTHNNNVIIASPVEFVPKFNCWGVNFCWPSNPSIAWKIQLYGWQKWEIFSHNTTLYYFLLFTTKVVFVLLPYQFFCRGKLCCDLQNALYYCRCKSCRSCT